MSQKHRKTCQWFILETKTVSNELKLLMPYVFTFNLLNKRIFSPNFIHWSFCTTKRRTFTPFNTTKRQLTEQVQAMTIHRINQNKFNDNLHPKSWISLVDVTSSISTFYKANVKSHTRQDEQRLCYIQC